MSNQPLSSTSPSPPFLTAVVVPTRTARSTTRLWWVTLFAVVGVVALMVMSLKSHGPTILIRFAEGHGLKTGDVLRFRGIVIGEVTEVVLTPDLGRVAVKVRLQAKAAHVARQSVLDRASASQPVARQWVGDSRRSEVSQRAFRDRATARP